VNWQAFFSILATSGNHQLKEGAVKGLASSVTDEKLQESKATTQQYLPAVMGKG
jgi:hypothetical protein